eukprot:g7657.t1
MPPPRQQSTRGPKTALHKAAFLGSTRGVLSLLSQGSFDVDQGCEDGATPLMLASYNDSPGVVRALLDAGASVSLAKDDGITALFSAADSGSLAVTKMLAAAGADLEAPVVDGGTSLHVAAEEGHDAVISALVEAGADTGSRRRDGATPLYLAARTGRVEAVRVLLRAKADPLLAFMNYESGQTFIPLDAGAMFGHSGVVRELLERVGIRGCGGPTRGYNAFRMASLNQHVNIMAMLTDAGVVDTGEALLNAAQHCHLEAAKFLHRSVTFVKPLVYVTQLRNYQKRDSKIVSQQTWNTLEAIRTLLLREEAVHATSWVWPRVGPSPARAASGGGSTGTPSAWTSLGRMLPILRRRTESCSRTLVRTMFRHSSKKDQAPPTW